MVILFQPFEHTVPLPFGFHSFHWDRGQLPGLALLLWKKNISPLSVVKTFSLFLVFSGFPTLCPAGVDLIVSILLGVPWLS